MPVLLILLILFSPLSAAETQANSVALAPSNSSSQPASENTDNTLKQFKGYDQQGKVILCDKIDTQESQNTKAVYRCRSKNEALGEDKKSERGEGETNTLINHLLEQSLQSSTQTIELSKEQIQQIQQIKASQDNSLEQAERPDASQKTSTGFTLTTTEPGKNLIQKSYAFIEKIPIQAYVSLRLNGVYHNNSRSISDGGSRAGLIYAHTFDNQDKLIAHAEFGSNIFDRVDSVFNQSRNIHNQTTITRRLSYIRYGRDDYYAVFGKNWSVYHYIAGMTDRFIAVGGKSAAIYNAKTDGGASGTGRADNAIQLRSSRGVLQWGIQLQANNAIEAFNHVNYDLAAALMFKIKTESGFGFGSAINRAIPEQYTPEMLAANFNGNSTAHTIGLEWDYFKWYFAMVFSQSQNHVTDDLQQYYDARGLELYSSRQITARQMLRLGLNWQKPDEPKNYAGQHQIEEYYLSWQFNYNRGNTKDIIYSEYAYNRGRLADGSRPANRWVIGIRYHWQN